MRIIKYSKFNGNDVWPIEISKQKSIAVHLFPTLKNLQVSLRKIRKN